MKEGVSLVLVERMETRKEMGENIWGQWVSCTIISDLSSGARLRFAIR